MEELPVELKCEILKFMSLTVQEAISHFFCNGAVKHVQEIKEQPLEELIKMTRHSYNGKRFCDIALVNHCWKRKFEEQKLSIKIEGGQWTIR
jgi:hypothetical protein